jgi:hypothetical protein
MRNDPNWRDGVQATSTFDKKQSRIVDGFVFGRHDDLEEFAIVRPTHHGVADAWWLDPARASYQALWSDAFKVRLKPSSEAIDKLKLHIVVMSPHEEDAIATGHEHGIPAQIHDRVRRNCDCQTDHRSA